MRRVDAATCALTRWQHLSAWNDVMAAILKIWHQIEYRIRAIDAWYFGNYLHERTNPAKFHPNPISRLLWRALPQQEQQKEEEDIDDDDDDDDE